MTRPPSFVTSVRVSPAGAHEYVSVWIRGQNVGTLVVGKGDGEPLADRLRSPCVDVEPGVVVREGTDAEQLEAINRWRAERGLSPIAKGP